MVATPDGGSDGPAGARPDGRTTDRAAGRADRRSDGPGPPPILPHRAPTP
ncbi:hypothetical protein KPATCC21470_1437 [Kitasatospora purpeofusca]